MRAPWEDTAIWNGDKNNDKCRDVQHADDGKHHLIAEAEIEQPSREKVHEKSAHRAAESHEPGHGRDDTAVEEIGWNDHHER